MEILTVLCYALIVVVALLLIGLIMIQPSKSGGMGEAFGGIGEAFGGKAGSHLTKATVIMTTIFFVVALALAAFIGHRTVGSANNNISDGMRSGGAPEAPKTEAPKAEVPKAEAPKTK